MSQELIDELRRENLATHFVLPLLKLNKFSFIASNFLNVFLSANGDKLMVQILEPNLLSRKVLRHEDCRGLHQSVQGQLYVVYSIPRKWAPDVQLFIEGKFSQMSKGAKEQIQRYCGLPYYERSSNRAGKVSTLTDGRLLALERHELLRSMWERELSSDDGKSTGLIRLQKDMELLSIPGSESYMDPDQLKPAKRTQLT